MKSHAEIRSRMALPNDRVTLSSVMRLAKRLCQAQNNKPSKHKKPYVNRWGSYAFKVWFLRVLDIRNQIEKIVTSYQIPQRAEVAMNTSAQSPSITSTLRRLGLLSIRRLDQEFEDCRGDVIERQIQLIQQTVRRARLHLNPNAETHPCPYCDGFFVASNKMLRELEISEEKTTVVKRELIKPMWNFLLTLPKTSASE